MRNYFLLFILIFLVQDLTSQPTIRAELLKSKYGFVKGDTLTITGYFTTNSHKYAARTKTGGVCLFKPSYLRIIDTIDNFWDKQWFEARSGEIARKGWGNGIRKELRNRSSALYNNLKADDLLLEDSTLNSYLNNLVHIIGPQKLYKNSNTELTVHVIKSDIPEIFSFDDGRIFITTQMLVNSQTEDALIKLLTREISHIVCDHQFIGLKTKRNTTIFAAIVVTAVAVATIAAISSSDNHSKNSQERTHHYHNYAAEAHLITELISFVPPRVAYSPPPNRINYTSNQMMKANQVTSHYIGNELNKIDLLTPNEYCQSISPSITYTAWDLYFKAKYKESLAWVNKLENLNSCTGDDYLLKAKLLRNLYSTDEAAYEALRYLELAKNSDNKTNIEIIKEEGLIYLQLKEGEKAKISFEEYKYALEQLGVSNKRDKQEIAWAESMISKANSLNKP